MILPTKHIPEDQALLGLGAIVLGELSTPQTVTSLWGRVRHSSVVGTYERFVLALDLLYLVGLVRLSRGFVERVLP